MFLAAILCSQVLWSQWVVTSTADSGPGTLREQISFALDGDEVSFSPVIWNQTILLNSQIDVNYEIKITGPGADIMAISSPPGSSFSMIFVAADSFQISGLTFRDHEFSSGGAAINNAQGVFIVEDCVFKNITAGTGAAIILRTEREKQSIFRRCLFQDCHTDNVGGAIHVSSSYSTRPDNFLFESCTFYQNLADNQGGAIYTYQCGLKLDRCTFYENEAMNTGGAVSLGSGGSLEADHCTIACNKSDRGGGVFTTLGTLDLYGNLIAQNIDYSGDPADLPYSESPNVLSRGYNLISAMPNISLDSTDILGAISQPINAELETSLQFVSASHAVLPITCYSDAFNAADPLSTTEDAIGQTVFAGTRDIGAFEIQQDCDRLCPYAEVPKNLSHSIDVLGNVTLRWDLIVGSQGCQISGQEVGLPIANLAATPFPEIDNLTLGASVFEPGKSYYWRVRCACRDIFPYDLTDFTETEEFVYPILRTSSDNSTAKIYPNPLQGNLLYVDGLDYDAWELYGINGQLIDAGQVNNGSIEFAQPLDAGNYLILVAEERFNLVVE